MHWAVSTLGYNIDLFFSPNFRWQADAKPLLFIGGVHGDEYEGVELATKTLHYLDSLYNAHPDVKINPWVLIPCINPEGYAMKQRTNSRGVDLNRNFPSRDWSSHIKSSRYNPGTFPASEPEVRALVGFISNYKPRLIIHCHSWHPSITFTGNEAPAEAKALADATAYPLQPDIGYPTPGSLGQFAWLEHQIPVICIEEQEGTAVELVWPHFENGIKRIFHE
jgi:murein peptide amidase A